MIPIYKPRQPPQPKSNPTNYWNRMDLTKICPYQAVHRRALDLLLISHINLENYEGSQKIILYIIAIRTAIGNQMKRKECVIQNIENIDDRSLEFRDYGEVNRNKQLFVRIMQSQNEILGQLNNSLSSELLQKVLKVFQIGNSNSQPQPKQKQEQQKQQQVLTASIKQDPKINIVQLGSKIFYQLVQFVQNFHGAGHCSQYQIKQFVFNLINDQEITSFLASQIKQIGQAVYQDHLKQRYEKIFRIFWQFFERMKIEEPNRLLILNDFKQRIHYYAYTNEQSPLSNCYTLDLIKKNVDEMQSKNYSEDNKFHKIPQSNKKQNKSCNKKGRKRKERSEQQKQKQKDALMYQKINKTIKKRGHGKQSTAKKSSKQKPRINKSDLKTKTSQKLIKKQMKKQISQMLNKYQSEALNNRLLNKLILRNYGRSQYKYGHKYLIPAALKLKLYYKKQEEFEKDMKNIRDTLTEAGLDHLAEGFEFIVFSKNAVEISTGIVLILLKSKVQKIKKCLFEDSTANNQDSGSLGKIIQWCKQVIQDNKLNNLSQSLFLHELMVQLLHLLKTNKQKTNENYSKLIESIQAQQEKSEIGKKIYHYLCQQFNIQNNEEGVPNHLSIFDVQRQQILGRQNEQMQKPVLIDKDFMQKLYQEDSINWPSSMSQQQATSNNQMHFHSNPIQTSAFTILQNFYQQLNIFLNFQPINSGHNTIIQQNQHQSSCPSEPQYQYQQSLDDSMT